MCRCGVAIQFDIRKRSSNGIVMEFYNFLPRMPVPNVVSSDVCEAPFCNVSVMEIGWCPNL